MQTEIIKIESQQSLVNPTLVVEAILNGEVHTPEELSDKFNLPLASAIKILNDQQFLLTIGNYSKAKANLNFHTKGINKLIQISESEDNKEAMQAIKFLATFTNNVKASGTDVNVNLNLNNLLDAADQHEKKEKTLDIDFQKL